MDDESHGEPAGGSITVCYLLQLAFGSEYDDSWSKSGDSAQS